MTCDKDSRTSIFYFFSNLNKIYYVIVSFLESLLVKMKNLSCNKVVFLRFLYKGHSYKKSNLNM